MDTVATPGAQPALPLHLPGVSITAAAVRLGPSGDRRLVTELIGDAVEVGRDVDKALALAANWGERLPRPGGGETTLLWEALATLGACDLQVARAVEPHLDALSVLHELGDQTVPERSTWGVFAAEGVGVRLEASPTTSSSWTLTGTKPWCSLAEHLSHALITAWVGDERRLFAVDLRQPGVAAGTDPWVARGLPDVRSASLGFGDAAAAPIGAPGWYLRRDGFAWGGIGVAAVWYGGAVGVARTLRAQAETREPDQIAQQHLGAVDGALYAARAVLSQAATMIDQGQARGEEGALLALRARNVVVAAAEEVLRRVDHALGPAPLVRDEQHAARVSDLHLYLRQHHAERDQAALGRHLMRVAAPW